MGVDLPQTPNASLPMVPKGLPKELSDYLLKLNATLQGLTRGHFNNDLNIANIIASGTSGTFVIASGGHIAISSGIVISVSTT